MTDFYRFRSLEQLLGKYAELERQTIFFAAPEDLNDPMDGLQDVVWVGDRMAWAELFRNYVRHLSYYCSVVLTSGETPVSDPESVPREIHWYEPPSAEAVEMAEAAWANVRNDSRLKYLIIRLADSRRKVRRQELLLYIRAIHKPSLEIIRRNCIEGKMASADGWPYNPIHYKTSPTPIEMLDQMHEDTDEILRRAFSSYIRDLMAGTAPDQVFSPYWDSPWLMAHMPTAYVTDLCHLARPRWYAACFTSSFDNASMWSHYGDRHRGACLIFHAKEISDGPGITLDRRAESDGTQSAMGSPKPMPFYEVRYGNALSEIDFFNSIGKKQADWRTSHSAVAAKTKDWEYEQEYRLVLDDELEECKDIPSEATRTMTYDFRALKGIIFGTEMSDGNKMLIKDIIGRKCIEHSGRWFEFYQAYYSPAQGGIRAREHCFTIVSP